MDKWQCFFDTKVTTAGWLERDKLTNFSDYLEGEAFCWYLTEVFDTNESWESIKESMLKQFAAPVGDPFRWFIHCRLKGSQLIKQYHEEKAQSA